ncbi:hypothetical protein GUJ93_ZPchr0013g36126 [Zizania palustris]|uniref:Uncharacterized protein n=1 Tax=Zizania palustris TaxID=103762 RepID=A0A8J5WWN4_ZIZPA|nr:hypothetical protein GUJ93_ZPchr0013g36126 [Zizania palustris]
MAVVMQIWGLFSWVSLWKGSWCCEDPLAAKDKRVHPVAKDKGPKPHAKHRSPPPANANTKRSKTKGQSMSKTNEHRYSPHGFLHLQPFLRGQAHKEIDKAQQNIVSEIKSIFSDLIASSLNTESPRDARRKRRAERPLGTSSPNIKWKSQTPREVSPAHIDGGDDGLEIIVEDSPQLSAGQSSFEQQEAAPAPADTYVQ